MGPRMVPRPRLGRALLACWICAAGGRPHFNLPRHAAAGAHYAKASARGGHHRRRLAGATWVRPGLMMLSAARVLYGSLATTIIGLLRPEIVLLRRRGRSWPNASVLKMANHSSSDSPPRMSAPTNEDSAIFCNVLIVSPSIH
jgi:hypothetical protein